MKKKLLLGLVAGCFLGIVTAQPPSGYYDTAAGLTGTALQQALHSIIDDHTVKTYSEIWTCFRNTDTTASGDVWDMYSDIPGGISSYTYTFGTDQCGNYSGEGDCYNREHSFPKSWFDDRSPMLTDLFHIYPTDGWVNGKRSNYPFGEVSVADWTSSNGSKLGDCSWPGYAGKVFEPIDQYKGDFARTYFYMATRYYGEDASWTGSDMVTGAQPKAWALSMLLSWNRADPVSAKEISRNNEVYKFQNNRNPFIDEPLFVERIWGTLNAISNLSENAKLELYPNPALNKLNVHLQGYDCPGASVVIFDLNGCSVRQATLEDGITELDVDDLRSGIYFLVISCKDKTFRDSFVVSGK